ncbi:DUF2793 domain-containing protein [Porphyrobacter sp. SLTP]|uniref:DUF2793 domain-containing protein n=1 Tax=Porphyrobacter sp. SLTP TaxID=2683266 RepID=UPI00141330A2|nr:DUF2793 domain-containing protein [Porphyrobacter sp. SLTP]NBB24085.1 DUF2793 domain-containing protein [Porphyrobacter sp. SLTP]
MSDPIALASTSPTIGLPLLIPGQAQKEFFVNQALCLLDALHPRTVTASQPAPPQSPTEGDCFRVTAPAAGAWAGYTGTLAVRIGGDWHFVAPREGMQVFDLSAGHAIVYRSEWESAAAPAEPAGGTIIDTQARAAITSLIQALLAVGILATEAP